MLFSRKLVYIYTIFCDKIKTWRSRRRNIVVRSRPLLVLYIVVCITWTFWLRYLCYRNKKYITCFQSISEKMSMPADKNSSIGEILNVSYIFNDLYYFIMLSLDTILILFLSFISLHSRAKFSMVISSVLKSQLWQLEKTSNQKPSNSLCS